MNSASAVLIYNAAYDMRLLDQTAERYDLSFSFDRSKIHCIQLAYAALRREPNPYRADEWKWHKLAGAHAFECRGGKRRASVQSHRAESDCHMVLEVLRAVSARAGSRAVPRESGDWFELFRREVIRLDNEAQAKRRRSRYSDDDDDFDYGGSSGWLGLLALSGLEQFF